MVGENFKGENWSGNKDKVQQLFHYTPSDNVVDVSSKLSSASKGDSLQLPLQEEGTHMVVFNSTNSFISLEADKFNEYLKEDGLE
jgi:CRISPR/Cas system CMR-associated protein Cmr3 (group 5 of RAMP superfamily)